MNSEQIENSGRIARADVSNGFGSAARQPHAFQMFWRQTSHFDHRDESGKCEAAEIDFGGLRPEAPPYSFEEKAYLIRSSEIGGSTAQRRPDVKFCKFISISVT